jgi:hypothetical protein
MQQTILRTSELMCARHKTRTTVVTVCCADAALVQQQNAQQLFAAP